jgi:flavin reductase (DIM6/NTAB) family NADH-FMN oxidoreductase RutF
VARNPFPLRAASDDEDRRRRVLWTLPTVLAVLGTRDERGRPHLMNISWVTPVANEPCRLVASVETASHSAANLRAHPQWALSLLDPTQRDLGRAFVKPDLAIDESSDGLHVHGHAVRLTGWGAPVLDDAVAALAGTASALADLGDHGLWLLSVDEVGGVDEVFAGPASAHDVDVLRVQQTRMNYGR